jgi:nickel-dependent lactate racemase
MSPAKIKICLKLGQGKEIFQLGKEKLLGIIKVNRKRPVLKNFIQKFKRALSQPDFGVSLKKSVQPGEKTVIVISDRTRETLVSQWLPVLLEELNSFGIPDEKITLIFAVGAHQQQSKKEQLKIIGPAASRVKFFDHDSRDQKNLVRLGTTSFGTPVELNKKFLEAPNKILTGVISYHYFAGFTGGRKSVLPGLASFKAIQKNHGLLYDRRLNRRIFCTTGVLGGNPLSDDMTEAARLVRPSFLINFVLDGAKRPLAIFSGDFEKAHEKGCHFFDGICRVFLEKPADLVVASAGGYPKDLDFVQAHKAVDNAVRALKSGGVLIFLAEAARTFPSEKYRQAFQIGESDLLEEKLLKNYCVPTQTCLAFLKKALNYRIIWVSKYMKRYQRLMRIEAASGLAEAFKLAKKWLPENYRVYIMPEAALTLPQLVTK